MHSATKIFGASICSMLLATSAIAQTQDAAATEEEVAAADEAADVMLVEIYGGTAPQYVTVRDAIARMQEMGYTNIHDLDVEWGHYEVEAYAPDGNEVEIEFDPVTGAITDVEDNWF